MKKGSKIEERIKYLKELLKERQEEYKIFGATNEDLKRDGEIAMKIVLLKRELKQSENEKEKEN